MNDKTGFFIFWTIVVALIVWWGHGKIIESEYNARMEKQRVEQEATTAQMVRGAVDSYGAVNDWSEKLKNFPSYSIQVQEVLMPANGAPIIIQGSLDDIGIRNGEYYFSLHDLRSNPEISFVISCDLPTKQLLNLKNNQYRTFSIVTKITSVEKVTASDSNANSDDFVAQGECVSVIRDFP